MVEYPQVFVLHWIARYRPLQLVCFVFPIEVPGELDTFVRTYAREQDEIWKKQFSRVWPHDLYWENKTYKLKRSIREVKHHVTYNVKRKFVPRDQASPLQYTCRLLFIISTHK